MFRYLRVNVLAVTRYGSGYASNATEGGLQSSHTCGRFPTARRQQRRARHPDKLQVVRHAMEKVQSDHLSRTRSVYKEPIKRGLGRIEVQGDGLGSVQLNASSRICGR